MRASSELRELVVQHGRRARAFVQRVAVELFVGTMHAVVGETDRFDHCVFTIREDLGGAVEQMWLHALFAMQYDNPAHREMMDLEGLKAWLPGRTTGFGPLTGAVASEGFFETRQP